MVQGRGREENKQQYVPHSISTLPTTTQVKNVQHASKGAKRAQRNFRSH